MPFGHAAHHQRLRSEVTGETISVWSEQWRHESEVAYLLDMPLRARNRLLDGDLRSPDSGRGIKAVRGPAEVEFLRAEVAKLRDIRAGKSALSG